MSLSSGMYGLPKSSPTWEFSPTINNYFDLTPSLKPVDLSKIQNESPTRHIAIYTTQNTKKLSDLLHASGDLKSFYPCTYQDTMIASFYDLRHATIALRTLSSYVTLFGGHVCYAKPELVQGITNKTVLIEMKGPPATLSKFNYLNFLSTFGSIHYMTSFQLSEMTFIVLLEYHDERVHAELDNKLDKTTTQGIYFSVHQATDDYACTSCFSRERSKSAASFEQKIKAFWTDSPPLLPSFLDYKVQNNNNSQDLSYFSTNPFEDSPKQASPSMSSKRSSIESQSSLISPTTPVKSNDNTKHHHKKKSSDMNEFDLDRILRGEDTRTTFMIRNIPNKYTQQMLIDNINATHHATYDFLYLRIDFKNKCNVGYAFINFIDVNSVISFAKERVGKKWGKFNSEKVCSLSYANIQGKEALIKKFRNSNVMQEEEAYRPKIFYSTGPLKGEEETFPDKEFEYENKPQKNNDRHHRHHR